MPQPDPATGRATSRLRLLGYSMLITALTMSQSTGRIIPDTKFDLVQNPWKFLSASTTLWDPGQAFGQIRFQAYGYLWPMGPFFGVGELMALPEWAIQRLWWALLLNVAFFGVLLVLREMRVGVAWTQVAAAASFILALRFSTLLGANSVELWPSAVAPWVLLALIHGSRRGSVVKWAGLAGLAVACAGGVNATAASAVVPMGVIWIVTRAPGPRRWRLLGWWTLFTVLACLWWLVPLMLFGRYSPPILGYMENSTITQSVTDLTNSMLGTSNWVAYLSGGAYPAGSSILTTPFVLLDAAAVAAVGIIGICLASPHRRFAVWTLLVGLALVGFGYAGEMSGIGADHRRDLLDGSLAALRNTHKYDGAVRMALAIGIAHALAVAAASESLAAAKRARTVVIATVVVVLCGLTFPWLANRVASPGGFEAVPDYWQQTSDYLAHEGVQGTALLVPAAAFGDYTWGSTHDDVMQPIADSPWAARNVLPLTAPGNVVLLDRITAELESGRSSPEMVQMLREAGVGQIVVRNDLNRWITGAPDPAYVHATLDGSPGLMRVAGFGPEVGLPQVSETAEGRVVANHGLSGVYNSVEVYRVLGAETSATLTPASQTLMGAPGDARLEMTGSASPADVRRVVMTDSDRRQETAFQAVRGNHSSTNSAGSLPRLHGSESFHRYLDDQERWQTTLVWQGIARVDASASQADADQALPLNPGASASAAFDRNRLTSWRSPGLGTPGGQWLQVFFDQPREVNSVGVLIDPGSVSVDALRITAGAVDIQVPAPPPGERVWFDVGASDAASVRVTAVGGPSIGSFAIAELSVDNVKPVRLLRLADPPSGAVVDRIELHRDQESSACPVVGETVACQSVLISTSEDGDELNREFSVNASADYAVQGEASFRRGRGPVRAFLASRGLSIRTTGVGFQDVAGSRLALADGDPGTTWEPRINRPTIKLKYDEPRRVDRVQLRVGDAAPVSVPTRVRITNGDDPSQPSVVADLDSDAGVDLPGWLTSSLTISVLKFDESFDESGYPLRTGISDILINGQPLIDQTITEPCGQGPTLAVNNVAYPTEVSTTLSAAMRGEPTALTLCDDPQVRLPTGQSELIAAPSQLFRVDSLSLIRDGAEPEQSQSVPVRRSASGAPISLDLAESGVDRVLSLPQNVNAGWVATVGGVTLKSTQVAGWQQAWVVPAGTAGTVSFSYPPNDQFTVGLLVGLVAVLVVIVVVAWPSRGRVWLPELAVGSTSVVDVVVLAAVMAWLGGWIGVVVAAIGAALWRRWPLSPALPQAAAAAFALAAAQRIWPQEVLPGWTSQGLSVVAVALVAGSILANGPMFFSRRIGRSRNR